MRCVLRIATAVVFLYLHSCHGLAVQTLREDWALKRSNGSITGPESMDCGFVGNSDIYGIGIRVGYYTQTLSVWFANYFVFSEAKLLRSINILFLFAVFIGLIWMSHIPSQTYTIEAYIVLTLLITTWHVGILNNSRFSDKQWKSTTMTSFVRVITMCAVSGYNFWFWWFGLDRMERTPCGTFVWAVVKTDIYDWVRIVNKAIAACFLVTVFWMHLKDIIDIVNNLYVPGHSDPGDFHKLRKSLQEEALTYDGINHAQVEGVQHDGDSVSLPPDWTDAAYEDLEHEHEINRSYLQVAIHLSLPPSPCVPSIDDESQNQEPVSIVNNPRTNPELPSLVELLEAERFLQFVLDFNMRSSSLHCFTFFEGTRWLFNIYVKKFHMPKYYWKKLATIFTHRPLRLDILAPLISNLVHLKDWNPILLPTMIATAIGSPCYKSVSPLALHTILAFHTAQLPAEYGASTVLLKACWSLLMCILMILFIELSLVWNNVSGMGNFGAVGQLIPAILGSGGLVRVLWIWWSRKCMARREREECKAEHELKECALLYEELKRKYEGRIMLNSRGDNGMV